MLTIARETSNRIISAALMRNNQAFTAVLPAAAADYIAVESTEALRTTLVQNPQALVIYNQNEAAQARIDSITFDHQQIFIEIRQETRGVLGLQARRGTALLELVYS